MKKTFAIALLVILVLTACSTPAPVPTVDVNAVQTEAAATIVARITSDAALTPQATNTSTPVPVTPTVTIEPSPSITSTAAKCNDAEWVKDVTIIDGANLTSGELITKTWLVKNTGSCTWSSGYKLVFGYGDNLSGAKAVVPAGIAPGDEVEISLEFSVPQTKKKYYSYWRLVDDLNEPYGEFLSLIFIVE